MSLKLLVVKLLDDGPGCWQVEMGCDTCEVLLSGGPPYWDDGVGVCVRTFHSGQLHHAERHEVDGGGPCYCYPSHLEEIANEDPEMEAHAYAKRVRLDNECPLQKHGTLLPDWPSD